MKGITLNLLNCTRISVTDVTINRGYFMVLTAFNGGGGHTFRRVVFNPTLNEWTRDAIHFSDQRVGPLLEDCVIGYSGDDLFNIHTTLMVVLKCETPSSCLMINPHLAGPEARNTVYGTNSVLEMVTPGLDKMSFHSWPVLPTTFVCRNSPILLGIVTARRSVARRRCPAAVLLARLRFHADTFHGMMTSSPILTHRPTPTFDTAQYPGGALVVKSTERIHDKALLAEAATLVPELTSPKKLNPVSMAGNVTVGFKAWDLWRVDFEGTVAAGVGRTAYVQIDTISNAGTILKNNIFTNTNCNLGRYKSSDSIIVNNTFRNVSVACSGCGAVDRRGCAEHVPFAAQGLLEHVCLAERVV